MPQIELIKTHTHAREVHGAGDVIDVDDVTANWLIEHGVGRTVEEGAADVTAPAANSPQIRRSRRNDGIPVSHITSNKE